MQGSPEDPGSAGPAAGSSPRYELLRTLASGGMAVVYEARAAGERGFARRVAIKRVLPEFSGEESMRRMFFDEARILSHLHHGNIVQVLDYGTIDGSQFIAMEYIDGLDLGRALRRAERQGTPCSPPVALFVTTEMAQALAYAHDLRDERGGPLGVVHRDVTPHNILLSWNGDVKLTDFGIALAAGRNERTATGIVKGKLSYMAPEQAAGRRVSDRADVYSLGATLLHMLSGPLPDDPPAWNAPGGPEIDARRIDDSIAALIRACMQRRSTDRPTAREVAAQAGALFAAHSDRPGRQVLVDWVKPLRADKAPINPLDQLIGLCLIPAADDSRSLIVSRRQPAPVAGGAGKPSPAVAVSGAPEDEPTQPRRRMRGMLWWSLSGAAAAAALALWSSGVTDPTPTSARGRAPDEWPGSVADSEPSALSAPRSGPAANEADATTKAAAPRAPALRRQTRRSTRRRHSAAATAAPAARQPSRAEAAGWLRVGGLELAGKQVLIDGKASGYAPMETQLPGGAHRVVVRGPGGAAVLDRRVVVSPTHTRVAPLKILR